MVSVSLDNESIIDLMEGNVVCTDSIIVVICIPDWRTFFSSSLVLEKKKIDCYS